MAELVVGEKKFKDRLDYFNQKAQFIQAEIAKGKHIVDGEYSWRAKIGMKNSAEEP